MLYLRHSFSSKAIFNFNYNSKSLPLLSLHSLKLSLFMFQIRKAVRATFILFPLLGLTNLLFFINPAWLQKKEHEYSYMVVNSILKSSQVSYISPIMFKCYVTIKVLKWRIRVKWPMISVRSETSCIGSSLMSPEINMMQIIL